MHISWYDTGIPIQELKPHYTAHGVPLTKMSLRAHLVALNERIGISLVEVCERVGK